MSVTKKNDVTELLGRIATDVFQPLLLPVVYNNMLPDVLIRFGICRQLDMDLAAVKKLSSEELLKQKVAFINELKTMDIAIAQKEANEQHYEVPDEFYQIVLGPCLKYSSCYYPTEKTTLAEAEIHMLEMYCERAGLVGGQRIIDLGCGWGSVTLYVAAKYPNSQITSISNSNSQREFIMSTAAKRGLKNVNVFTGMSLLNLALYLLHICIICHVCNILYTCIGDIKTFDLPAELHGQADRVISIEMFEHMYVPFMLYVSYTLYSHIQYAHI